MSKQANNSQDKVRSFQRAPYQAAKRRPKRRFHALYDKICRWDILERTWKLVRANRDQGGVDGETIEAIERGVGVEAFLRQVHEELPKRSYRPCPVDGLKFRRPVEEQGRLAYQQFEIGWCKRLVGL